MWLVLMWLALMWLVRMATEPMNDGAMRHVVYAMRTPETTIMLIGRPGFQEDTKRGCCEAFLAEFKAHEEQCYIADQRGN
jgi:hypothetical protein